MSAPIVTRRWLLCSAAISSAAIGLVVLPPLALDAHPAPVRLSEREAKRARFLAFVRTLTPPQQDALLSAMEDVAAGGDMQAAMTRFGIACGHAPDDAAALVASTLARTGQRGAA